MTIRVLNLAIQICFITFVVNAQVAWDYPVKPGMEEWNRLETEQERIDVLQIPGDVLASLSSEEVVRLCITFPSFGHFTAWNTPQEGFDVMLSRYNILRHILSSKNTGGSLINAYKDASLSGFKTLPYSNEFWSLKLDYLELLLTQKEILQSLTQDEKIELLLEVRLKYSEKINSDTFSSIPAVIFTTRIIASILDMDEYPELNASSNKKSIEQFIKTGWLSDNTLAIDDIIRIADDYINVKNNIK